MTDPARLSADAGEFAVGVIDEIGERDQERAGRAQPELPERQIVGAGHAGQESQRGQMIRRDAGADERSDQTAGKPRVPCGGLRDGTGLGRT